jgi:hypothetical protein
MFRGDNWAGASECLKAFRVVPTASWLEVQREKIHMPIILVRTVRRNILYCSVRKDEAVGSSLSTIEESSRV